MIVLSIIFLFISASFKFNYLIKFCLLTLLNMGTTPSTEEEKHLVRERNIKLYEEAKSKKIDTEDRNAYFKNPKKHYETWMRRSKQSKFLFNKDGKLWLKRLNDYYEEMYGVNHLLVSF